MLTKVERVYIADNGSRCWRPLFGSSVPAGFPSPADDYIERSLDLNEHLIRHPAATFFMRASGDSMIGERIHSGDLLVVDRAKEAADGSIVIAVLDGELTVKRLHRQKGRITLESANPKYPALVVSEETDFSIWGVVTHVVHAV